MKKILVAALIGLAPALAQAQNAFVEFGIGQSSFDVGSAPGVSVDDSDTTWNISGGWMFHPNFGAEIGYRDLGEVSATGPGGTASAEVSGFHFGAVGRFAVTERFSIVPRLGLYMWEADGGGVLSGASDDGSDLYFGVGADFALTKQITVGAHFVRFDIDGDDVDVFEARVGFRF
jgi:OOP family OmpA-OmpF porin